MKMKRDGILGHRQESIEIENCELIDTDSMEQNNKTALVVFFD